MGRFGDELKALRKEHGLSQKELAEILKVSQGTIGNYETNSRFPKEDMIKKVASFFNVSIDRLINGPSEDIEKDDHYFVSEIDQPIKPKKLSEAYFLEKGDLFYYHISSGNMIEAYGLVRDMFEIGATFEDIYLKIFEYCLNKLGVLWELGLVNVAKEHQISASVEMIMAQLFLQIPKQRKLSKKAICFGINGEKHIIGIKMVSNYLEYRGIESYFIGSDIPYEDLIRYIMDINPDTLFISVTLEKNEKQLEEFLEKVSEDIRINNISIVLGGKLFSIRNYRLKYSNYRISMTIDEAYKIAVSS